MDYAEFDSRYSRQIQLAGFGIEAQDQLSKSSVLVVGAGGLAIPALQYLTGMGIGGLGIIDDDIVSLSNLHRQVLYNTDDIGQSKVNVAVRKLSILNPLVTITAYNEQLHTENALRIIGKYDVVIDATDNISSRYLINDACVMLNKPFVYGAVQQYDGQLSVFNYQGGPTYRCLYPQPPAISEIPDCNTAGILGVIPAIIGSRQALEVIKIITGIGTVSSGSLCLFDLLHNKEYQLKLKVNPANKTITTLLKSYVLDTVPTIKAAQLHDWYSQNRKFRLIDVREAAERSRGYLAGSIHIPLDSISAYKVDDDGSPIILYCQKGPRSIKAVSVLIKQNPHWNIAALDGGIENWPHKTQLS